MMDPIHNHPEYFAAGLRQHLESLTHMIEEVERRGLNKEAMETRLKAVEMGLRRLRAAA